MFKDRYDEFKIYENIYYHNIILSIMLSKLNKYKYNNICNKFIEILNTIKPIFEKEINRWTL